MANITFNIPDEFLPRIINAIKGLYPVPQIPDPDFEIDTNNPASAFMAPLVNEFTDPAWAKERVRRFMLDTVRRYERKIAKEEAEASINVDDNLII